MSYPVDEERGGYWGMPAPRHTSPPPPHSASAQHPLHSYAGSPPPSRSPYDPAPQYGGGDSSYGGPGTRVPEAYGGGWATPSHQGHAGYPEESPYSDGHDPFASNQDLASAAASTTMLGVQHQYHGTGASTEDVPLMSAGGGRRPPPDDGFGTPMPGGFDPALIGNYGNYDDDQQSNVRYGRIPQRQPRRYKTIKRIELQHGNLVLDCKVPAKLLSMCPLKDDREFTHMRYTAATCDPNDYKSERFTLRPIMYETPRRTELFICATCYNEDDRLFTRTMHGVMKNIQYLCARDRSKTWGKDGWKKIVVCLVADGRDKINSRTLAVLAAMGVYQDGVAKNIVNNKPVTAHIFEYTTQISVDPEGKFKGAEKGLVPVQMVFCLKEKNAKKINSHRWCFNAFGPVLQPNVCILLDVGTQPGVSSIYRLWKAFDVNSNVGGACGEIVALKGKFLRNLLNPLVAAQNFEYKMSNILDKPLESVFGYISVLPGAFSAYRYIALQNDPRGNGPLREYFKGETLHHDPDADLWTKNMYLAEDRILCWELVSKRGSSWILHYVKSSYAVTDVPDQVPELISQRRRWLNGSFFAAIHSTVHFGYLYRSSHSFFRKALLHFELVYQIFTMLFAWFALANYYIAFIILTKSLEDPSFHLKGIKYLNEPLHWIYIGVLIMCFLLAMGNRPQGSKWMFTTAMVVFALITLYMTFAGIFIAVKSIISIEQDSKAKGKFDVQSLFGNSLFRDIVVASISTLGLWLISSILFLEPWHMFTSLFQYMLLAPSFINVINVYAFCNVHDISWGTKGDTKVSTDLGVVKASDAKKGQYDVAVPTDDKDINAAYDDACHVLATKPAPTKAKVDPEQAMKDSYEAIRTNVVLAWTLSNGALVAVILSTGAGANYSVDGEGSNQRVNVYMTFLLWSVFVIALTKSVGSLIYLVIFLFSGESSRLLLGHAALIRRAG